MSRCPRTVSYTHLDVYKRQAVGRARPGRRPGQLRVSFFWIFYSDYNVLALGDDYGWALVGGGSPKYLWILSRTPSLPQETLERILKLASDRGYDTDPVSYTHLDVYKRQEVRERPQERLAAECGEVKARLAAAEPAVSLPRPVRERLLALLDEAASNAVSYTHLDVYKRQARRRAARGRSGRARAL